MSRVTRQNWIVINEVVAGRNGADSVRKAQYKTKTPDQTAYTILKRPEIIREIDRLRAELAKKYEVTRESLVKETITLQNKTLNEHIKRDCIRLKAEITGNIKPHESKQTQVFINTEEKAILKRYGLLKSTDVVQPNSNVR